MSRIEFDSSQVNRLAVDLSKAPGRIQRKAPKVFARAAFEIKARIKRDASGHKHLPSLDSHVSYDRLGDLKYEIGFNKVGQGNLANIAVYGSINNAPVMESPMMAARREIPAMSRHLLDEGAGAVLGDSE